MAASLTAEERIVIFWLWGGQFHSKFDVVIHKTPLYEGMVVLLRKSQSILLVASSCTCIKEDPCNIIDNTAANFSLTTWLGGVEIVNFLALRGSVSL